VSAISQPLASVFPLKISANARYLVGADDKPWRIKSEFAWLLATRASPSDIDTYLADRKAKGFNAFTVFNIDRITEQDVARSNVNGDQPFLTANDFSTPNDAYFDYVDMMVDKAGAQGFAVLMFYTYAGYNGGNQGWYHVVAQPQNTKAVCYNFGRYLANRWKNKPNIFLMAGGDYTMPPGEARDRMHEIHRGLREGGCTHLGGSEWGDPDTLVTDQAGYTYGPTASSDLNLNSWYGEGVGYSGRVYQTADRAWSNTPTLPSYIEESMQGYGHYVPLDSTRPSIRKYQHWSVLAGGTAGSNWGLFELANQFIDGEWQVQLNDIMALDQQKALALYDSIPWWTMRPSGTRTDYAGRNLIVSTNNQDDSFIASSLSSDGSLLMAYVPPTGTGQRSFNVDLRSLSGDARARWWNPTTGKYANITGGAYTLANTIASQSFTTPGDNGTGSNDWMLVLDSNGTTNNSAPTIATAAAIDANPVTGTTARLSALGADDGGESALTYTWTASPTTAAFSVNANNAAKSTVITFSKAGAYTLTVTVKDSQGNTATSSVSASVSQVLTSITVSPTSASVLPNNTRQFSATAADQFGTGLSSQPSFTWTTSGGGSISTSGLFTAGGSTGGPFTITAAASSKSGTASVTVANAGSSSAVYQVNAGGSAVGSFSADQFATGGATASYTNTVDASAANAAPAGVYQSERYGDFSYGFGGLVAGNKYTVRLHFAELYFSAADMRVFNVTVNGAQVLSNFDVYSIAGKNKAVVRDFVATASSNGQIVVQYWSVKNNAKASGIELLSSTGGGSGSTPPTDPPPSPPDPTTPPLYRINSGGSSTGSFSADQFVTGGATASYANAVIDASAANAAPAGVYQAERYGDFSYAFGGLIAGKQYTVRLHFAETYFTAADMRVFNVTVNGAQVLGNFDLYAVAGKNTAIVRDFVATPGSNGQIVVQYWSVKNNAKASGIELF